MFLFAAPFPFGQSNILPTIPLIKWGGNAQDVHGVGYYIHGQTFGVWIHRNLPMTRSWTERQEARPTQ